MYKLKITAERIDGYCNQPILVGDSFMVDGSKILIPQGRHICMWALQSMMPNLKKGIGPARATRCLYARIPKDASITESKGFLKNDNP